MLLILIECEFLALIFAAIYLGAIAVLFLFVLMMLDLKPSKLILNKSYTPFYGAIICGVFLKFIIRFLSENFKDDSHYFSYSGYNKNLITLNDYWTNLLDCGPDLTSFGTAFFSLYPFQILIIGFILYVTVLGIVFLTRKVSQKSVKATNQPSTKQLSRKGFLLW